MPKIFHVTPPEGWTVTFDDDGNRIGAPMPPEEATAFHDWINDELTTGEPSVTQIIAGPEFIELLNEVIEETDEQSS